MYQDKEIMLTNIYHTDTDDTWLAALMEDDFGTVQEQLQQSNGVKKHQLLEGWIATDSFWTNWNCKEAKTQQIMTVQRPLSLAAVCGSYRVIDALYKAGIDILQTDELGNNVIHTLIIHTSRRKDKELKYLEMFHYLAKLSIDELFSKLLLTENTSSLRPVEMAAHFQAFRVMDAILKIPGPYLIEQSKCGTISIESYDVTDYEYGFKCRPWANSPMFLLMFLKSAKLKDEFTTEFLTKGLIGKWLAIRKKSYLPFIIVWAALRLFIILIAFFPAGLTDSAVAESRVCGLAIPVSATVKAVSCFSLIIITALCLLYDIYDTVHSYRLNKPWEKAYVQLKGNEVVRYHFYRIDQFLLNAVILASCLNRVSWYMWNLSLPVYVGQMLFVVIISTSVWSMLYFAQLMPVIGVYVMATQRMVYNLAKFSILMIVFVLPFAIIFPKFILRNDDGTCPDEYNSTVSVWYTSFTTILNINNFRSFDAPSRESLWLIHVMYVTIVAILLLNFLIAIFSDSYAEVANNTEVVTNIQWVATMATIDFRMPRFMYPLLRWMKRRHFSCIDGRTCVKDFRSKWNSFS